MDARLYQSVAKRLRRRIAEGVYPPGSRLPGERELADEFGVSRVTIREAEIALQASGYLEIRAGSGAYVTEPGSRAGGAVPAVSPLELTQARLLFESEAAALAAGAISDSTLQRLGTLVKLMSEDHADGDATSHAADREFHLTIAKSSGNEAVYYTIESLWRMRDELPEVHEAHAALCSDAMAKERGKEHRAIFEALRRRDPVAARAAMQAHFTRLLASMIDASEAKALEESRMRAAASRQRFLKSAS